MRQHEVSLEKRQLGVGNAGLRQLAETGVDAIDRLAGGQSLLDLAARAGDVRLGRFGQPDRAAAGRDPPPEGKGRRTRRDLELAHYL